MHFYIEENFESEKYEELIKNTESTFYHSKKYLEFLKKILDADLRLIVAEENGRINGALPFMIKYSKYGQVVNSLPYFGSYGGIISDDINIEKGLLEKLNEYNTKEDVISSVVISNPFLSKNNMYKKYFNYNKCEERLVQCIDFQEHSEKDVWGFFEQRTRRAIRKAKNNAITIKTNFTKLDMEEFHRLHKADIEQKGGVAKSKKFFESLENTFEKGSDFDIFLAYEQEVIAFLLVFYHKSFTEYYMPAYRTDFKNLQPTSLLIWESIKKSILKNRKYYNFGGTCKNQEELYKFKRGWGSKDYSYRYFIKRDLEKLKEIGLEKIKENFEGFYVTSYKEITN